MRGQRGFIPHSLVRRAAVCLSCGSGPARFTGGRSRDLGKELCTGLEELGEILPVGWNDGAQVAGYQRIDMGDPQAVGACLQGVDCIVHAQPYDPEAVSSEEIAAAKKR